VSGLGHEVKPLPDIRPADTARSKYDLPNGVRLRFQVSLNKVEPAVSNAVISLFSKDCCRAALSDEFLPIRPEVARVIKPLAFARCRETGAGAASGPDEPVVWPAGVPEGERPESAAGEEVALGVSQKLVWFDIFDAPLVDHPIRNSPGLDRFADDLGFERVGLVVPGRHLGTAGPQFMVHTLRPRISIQSPHFKASGGSKVSRTSLARMYRNCKLSIFPRSTPRARAQA